MASCRLFSTQQPEGTRWDTHQSRTLICTKKAKLPIITYKAPQDLALIICLTSLSTTPSQHPGCSSACQGCSYLRDMPRPLLSVIPQMVPEFIPSLPSLKVTLSVKLLQWPYLTFITRTIQHFLPHFTHFFSPETYHSLTNSVPLGECKLTQGKNVHVLFSTMFQCLGQCT